MNLSDCTRISSSVSVRPVLKSSRDGSINSSSRAVRGRSSAVRGDVLDHLGDGLHALVVAFREPGIDMGDGFGPGHVEVTPRGRHLPVPQW
jgi:hypothetical protein